MQSNHFKQTEDFFQALEYGREFLASKPSSFPDGLDIEGIDKTLFDFKELEIMNSVSSLWVPEKSPGP